MDDLLPPSSDVAARRIRHGATRWALLGAITIVLTDMGVAIASQMLRIDYAHPAVVASTAIVGGVAFLAARETLSYRTGAFVGAFIALADATVGWAAVLLVAPSSLPDPSSYGPELIAGSVTFATGFGTLSGLLVTKLARALAPGRSRWGGLWRTGVVVGIAAAWIWMVISILSPPNWRPEVAEKLYAAANAAGEGGEINMATVAPFAWDRMYEFEAYTTDEGVSRTIGFDWGTGDVARLPNDDFVLLIFADDRQVTGWVIINDYGSTGSVVTFDADLAGIPIDRERANFRIGRLSSSAGGVTRDAYELRLGR